MILFFDSCVISIFTMLTTSYSPIAKYNTKRKRVSHNMGLTFQITSKCKGHLATLTCKNAKKTGIIVQNKPIAFLHGKLRNTAIDPRTLFHFTT